MSIKIALVGCPLAGKRSFLARATGQGPNDPKHIFEDAPREVVHEHEGERYRVSLFAAVDFAGRPLPSRSLALDDLSNEGRAILNADAIIFVADAQSERYEHNVGALADLSVVLSLSTQAKPIAFFINKTDLDSEQGPSKLCELFSAQFRRSPITQGTLEGSPPSDAKQIVERLIVSVVSGPKTSPDPWITRSSSQTLELLRELRAAAQRAHADYEAQPDSYSDEDKRSLEKHIKALDAEILAITPPLPVVQAAAKLPKAAQGWLDAPRAVEETLFS